MHTLTHYRENFPLKCAQKGVTHPQGERACSRRYPGAVLTHQTQVRPHSNLGSFLGQCSCPQGDCSKEDQLHSALWWGGRGLHLYPGGVWLAVGSTWLGLGPGPTVWKRWGKGLKPSHQVLRDRKNQSLSGLCQVFVRVGPSATDIQYINNLKLEIISFLKF